VGATVGWGVGEVVLGLALGSDVEVGARVGGEDGEAEGEKVAPGTVSRRR